MRKNKTLTLPFPLTGQGWKKNGFSLIELIVVITIIAVITAIGTVSFAGTNKKARDGRRLADLEKIRMALEVAKQVGTTYPDDLDVLAPTYLNAVPVGPNGDTYDYEQLTSYTYTLDAWLEIGTTTGTYSAADCGADKTCNYRVTQP